MQNLCSNYEFCREHASAPISQKVSGTGIASFFYYQYVRKMYGLSHCFTFIALPLISSSVKLDLEVYLPVPRWGFFSIEKEVDERGKGGWLGSRGV